MRGIKQPMCGPMGGLLCYVLEKVTNCHSASLQIKLSMNRETTVTKQSKLFGERLSR